MSKKLIGLPVQLVINPDKILPGQIAGVNDDGTVSVYYQQYSPQYGVLNAVAIDVKHVGAIGDAGGVYWQVPQPE